ncbi:MAG: domain 2 [Verrucomicrobiota bacterium]
MVRVQGKEYGPVDMEALREWQREGRLIPTNEVRRQGDARWMAAEQLVELFSDVEPASDPLALHFRRRTIVEIILESFRIYRRGFIPFFVCSLLVSVPWFFLQWVVSYVNLQTVGAPSAQARTAAICTLLLFVVGVIIRIAFIAAVQIAAADLDAGKKITLGDLLRRAFKAWAPTAKLSLVVYGSYFFWTVIPLLAMLSLVSGGEISFMSILLVLLILCVPVYMTARLWVNFMFWQQTSVLEQRSGIEALRESKALARSRHNEPWLSRPLMRGAILVSFWLVVLLAVSSGAEMPFVFMRLQNITNVEDIGALWQTLTSAHAPDTLTILGSAMSSLVNALLRPLLGISFVLLYFDAKKSE